MLQHQKKSASAAATKKAVEAIRAQLQQELQSKKQCAFQLHECTQLNLEGFNYCLRHIMEDNTAPFKKCDYIYSTNGRRCHLPAPKEEKKDASYCYEHAIKIHFSKSRAVSNRYQHKTFESLLDSVTHYVAPASVKTIPEEDDNEDLNETDENIETVDSTPTIGLDPFTEIDVAEVNASQSSILDYASDTDSDVDPSMYYNVWHDAQIDSSGDESIDSEQEDILKHAGIYSAEEVTLVSRDKLIRLQSLYIEQFKYLQYILKDRKRRYLYSLRREKEKCSNSFTKVEYLEYKKMREKLKALHHYHKKHGVDAIMNKKFSDLRTKVTDSTNSKNVVYAKCTFSEEGVKCIDRALPVAKFCLKHILNDPNQVLFKKCSRVYADTQCNEPVLSIFNDPMCKYHMDYPPVRDYGESRTFDDSDIETSRSPSELPMFDPMASSSSDSKAPVSVESDLTNFSNQFPSDEQSYYPLIDFENSSEDYINEVTEEINMTKIDDSFRFSFSAQEESNNSLSTQETEKISLENDTEQMEMDIPTTLKEGNSDIALTVIDPDDDMAGIIMELQKENIPLPDDATSL